MASAGGAHASEWRPGKLGVAEVQSRKFSASLELLDFQFGPSASKFNKLGWICRWGLHHIPGKKFEGVPDCGPVPANATRSRGFKISEGLWHHFCSHSCAGGFAAHVASERVSAASSVGEDGAGGQRGGGARGAGALVGRSGGAGIGLQ